MKSESENWRELCAQAAEEQNPKKLVDLASRINTLLEEKESQETSSTSEHRFKANHSSGGENKGSVHERVRRQ